jgi:hypothetical protein
MSKDTMDNPGKPRMSCRQNEWGATWLSDALYVDKDAGRSSGELLLDAVSQVAEHKPATVRLVDKKLDKCIRHPGRDAAAWRALQPVMEKTDINARPVGTWSTQATCKRGAPPSAV